MVYCRPGIHAGLSGQMQPGGGLEGLAVGAARAFPRGEVPWQQRTAERRATSACATCESYKSVQSSPSTTPLQLRHAVQPPPSSVSVLCPAMPMPMAASASLPSSFWQPWLAQLRQKPQRALLPSLHSMLKPGLAEPITTEAAAGTAKATAVETVSPKGEHAIYVTGLCMGQSW